MRLIDLDNTSIKFYITESLRNDPRYTPHWDRLDEGFFKPWQQHLKLVEAQLTADQIQQIFASAEKEQTATGGNATVLGKIVEKIVPDSMLQKLSDNLPEPDPNAANDPQFQQKATQAVNALPVDAETKGGLMQIVKNAVTNPAVQPIVLSLVGSVIGGLMSKVGPIIAVSFPGGGTVAAGVTGAIVAGAVAVAAAKIQGKSWKDAFKGAIKPALAGAAGAVVGKLAGDFISSIGSGGDKSAAGGGLDPNDPDVAELNKDSDQLNKALAADEQKMTSITGKYPPEEGFQYQSDGGDRIRVVDANGNAVFTGDIKPQTMDAKTFADLANAGKTVQQQTNVGTGNQIKSDALDDFLGGPGKYDQMQTALSTQEKAAIGQDVAKQMGLSGDNVKFQGNVPVSVDGQPVPQNIQQNYGGAAAGGPQTQSREYHGPRLSEGQVYMVFNRVVARNDRLLTEGWLVEGPMDWIKKTAKNLTTKVTADKLNKAWQAAGSPLDSEAVSKVLGDAGVNADVVKKVYADLKIGAEAQPQAMTVDQVNDILAKLPVDRKVRLVNYMKNQLKVA